MSDAMDGGVRRGRREASTERSFGNTALPKSACPAQWLWLLSP
jgi:hypothetical protein